MNFSFTSLTALLLSVFVLLTGHGLQLTLVPLYAGELGWSVSKIGFMGSAYFAGFMAGCLTIPKIVSNVGHIRVFSVLSVTATSALLLLEIFHYLEFWLVARLITGWSLAGVYMVIESWLNERTSAENRGMVLSVYTVLTLVSVSLGQLLIGLGLDSAKLIILGAVLLALGSVPVGLTRSPAPAPIPAVGFKFTAVYKDAHVAIGGALLSGLVTSGFWVLGPLLAQSLGLAGAQIGWLLAVTVLGGALLQLPAGYLSDKIDRRIVLLALAVIGIIVCFLAFWLADTWHGLVYLFMFLFGGTTFPLYSISLAHANDNTRLPLIETGSVILLTHSAGAVVGPLLLAPAMALDPRAFFICAGLMLAVFALWAVWRISTHEVKREHFETFTAVPKTTHEIMEVYDSVIEEQVSER